MIFVHLINLTFKLTDMKFLKSLKLSLLFALMVGFSACNKEDDAATPEKIDPREAFAFSAENPPVQLPAAMQNSSNQYAQLINTFAGVANAMATYSVYFDVPEDAVFSTTPISAGNARLAGANYQVYTWTFGNGINSFAIAYQLNEDNDDYVYEIFFKDGTDIFYKFLEGRESKSDLSEGSLKWYGLDDSNEVIFTYTWTEKADGSFNMVFDGFEDEIVFDINADGSGAIEIFSGSIINASYTWNAAGTAGTYTSYDDAGNVEELVNWPE